jgi:hypothetical protein
MSVSYSPPWELRPPTLKIIANLLDMNSSLEEGSSSVRNLRPLLSSVIHLAWWGQKKLQCNDDTIELIISVHNFHQYELQYNPNVSHSSHIYNCRNIKYRIVFTQICTYVSDLFLYKLVSVFIAKKQALQCRFCGPWCSCVCMRASCKGMQIIAWRLAENFRATAT